MIARLGCLVVLGLAGYGLWRTRAHWEPYMPEVTIVWQFPHHPPHAWHLWRNHEPPIVRHAV